MSNQKGSDFSHLGRIAVTCTHVGCLLSSSDVCCIVHDHIGSCRYDACVLTPKSASTPVGPLGSLWALGTPWAMEGRILAAEGLILAALSRILATQKKHRKQSPGTEGRNPVQKAESCHGKPNPDMDPGPESPGKGPRGALDTTQLPKDPQGPGPLRPGPGKRF